MALPRFTVHCSKCDVDMEWFSTTTGSTSGYYRCPKCPNTVGGIGHAHQHNAEKELPPCPRCTDLAKTRDDVEIGRMETIKEGHYDGMPDLGTWHPPLMRCDECFYEEFGL